MKRTLYYCSAARILTKSSTWWDECPVDGVIAVFGSEWLRPSWDSDTWATPISMLRDVLGRKALWIGVGARNANGRALHDWNDDAAWNELERRLRGVSSTLAQNDVRGFLLDGEITLGAIKPDQWPNSSKIETRARQYVGALRSGHYTLKLGHYSGVTSDLYVPGWRHWCRVVQRAVGAAIYFAEDAYTINQKDFKAIRQRVVTSLPGATTAIGLAFDDASYPGHETQQLERLEDAWEAAGGAWIYDGGKSLFKRGGRKRLREAMG